MKNIEQALNRVLGGQNNDRKAKPASPTPAVSKPRDVSIDGVAKPGAAALAPHLNTRGLGAATRPIADVPILNADIDAFLAEHGGLSDDKRTVNGAYRSLRTEVLDKMKGKGARIVGVTSPTAGAGKTITAIHLAMACARRADYTIHLADFDYRRPSVARYMQAESFATSLDYFASEGSVSPFLTRSAAGNLRFFLTNQSTEMSAEFLASARMDEALAEMTKPANSYVIADLPPLIGCDDVGAMLPKLDAIVLAIPSGEYDYGTVERAVESLPAEKIIASVLTKVDASNIQSEYNY